MVFHEPAETGGGHIEELGCTRDGSRDHDGPDDLDLAQREHSRSNSSGWRRDRALSSKLAGGQERFGELKPARARLPRAGPSNPLSIRSRLRENASIRTPAVVR